MCAKNGSYTGDLREFILNRNEEQSAAFRSAAARLARTRYRAEHPTEIAAWKCMDGRLNLAVYTKTPPGIIQPFRNIGGKFDLGWPFFQETIKGWANYSLHRGRRCLILVTYHFSKGDHHRGCAGWKYDTGAAHAAAKKLAEQTEGVFGKTPRMVYPVVVGVETDEEGLVVHGANGDSIDMEALGSLEGLEEKIRDMFPDMDLQMAQDFLPLLKGNWEHIRDIRAENRPPIDLEHREQIIAVGRGFDWLHLPNKALIIGPYSHEWPSAVATAGKIILGNLNDGRVPKEEGVLLLLSSLSRDEEGSFGWNMAIEKAKYLERVSKDILLEQVPELKDSLQVFAGVTFADTRKLHPLGDSHA
ncbi:MAG TPA: hypothetical protein VNM40_00630 [Candidatus Paceibacterota bacterium]|nr:hypothetical protein [Candidatus Paceibacterota bacterium]